MLHKYLNFNIILYICNVKVMRRALLGRLFSVIFDIMSNGMLAL